MRRRVAIGDIHGRTNWKDHLNYDEIYFVGDYFDSYDKKLTTVLQVENFLEICKLAEENPNVHLCWGNHDYHYFMRDPDIRYSGYQNYGRFLIADALHEKKDLLKVLYVTDDRYILSHAGVTKHFMEKVKCEDPLELNPLFTTQPYLFDHAGYDPYGDDPINGPLWVRPRSLAWDRIAGYKQIVGHTQVTKIVEIDDIICVDTDGEGVFEF